MSQHAEFVDAGVASVFHLDRYSNADQPITQPVLVIDSGAGDIVIHGDHERIVNLLEMGLVSMAHQPAKEDRS